MKKRLFSILLIIVLMMSMLIGLTACGDEKDDEEDEVKSSKAKTSVLSKDTDDDNMFEEDEEEIELSDDLVNDSALKKAEGASATTKLAQANETIELIDSLINSDFYPIAMSDPTARIEDYFTKNMLDENLKKNGYELCTISSNKTKPDDMTSSAIGICYFTEVDGDGTIYKVEFRIAASQIGIASGNVVVI